MKIKNIFSEEMDYRQSIGLVLDALYFDFSMSPSLAMRKSKLETWHLALRGVSDKAIAIGYAAVVSEEIEYMPKSGIFKALCMMEPQLKVHIAKIEKEKTPKEKEGAKGSREKYFKEFKEEG